MMKPLSMEPGAIWAREHRKDMKKYLPKLLKAMDRLETRQKKEHLFNQRVEQEIAKSYPKELDFED